MTTPERKPRLKRLMIVLLAAAAACIFTIVLFYAVEDLRGWHTLQETKKVLAAEGINLDWKVEIPALVPDDQNVFGMPELQRWFTGHGATELSKKMEYDGANTGRMTVAELTVALPGTAAPPGVIAMQFADAKAAAKITPLVQKLFGPMVMDRTENFFFTKEDSLDVRPVQIALQCQSEPDEKAVKKFVPDPLRFTLDGHNADVHTRVEKRGDGVYVVTIERPPTMASYLKWMERTEPQRMLIREALKRPYARMQGDYSDPVRVSVPNFVMMRAIAQRLAAAADCSLMLGHPDDALNDLTLTHDLCRRVLEDNKPMTLVSAMINVAVRGLYADVIADGVQMRAWRDSELAALDEQMASINVLPPVAKALRLENKMTCNRLELLTPTEINKLFRHWDSKPETWTEKRDDFLFQLIPRGWLWQNIGTVVRCSSAGSIDAVNKIIVPEKAQAAADRLARAGAHWSPYQFVALWGIPNLIRACQTTARNQTAIHHAIIACALERYRLAQGEYPAVLDALTPKYLAEIPRDVIGGGTPQYTRHADGTFILYSVGWDGKYHGGKAGNNPGAEGDYVWPER